MATKKLVVKVVKLTELLDARKAVEAGEFHRGARLLNDFCWSNYTMQDEAGIMWGDLKLAALRLVSLVAGDTAGAQRIIGEIWKRIFPHLKPI